MYHKIKRFVLKIFPKSLLFRYEYQFRFLYYLAYIGQSYQCNVCHCKLRNFVKMGEDKLCPRCGSIQRVRRLWQLLNDDFLEGQKSILDFSPSRSIYRVMKKKDFLYVSSDLSGDFLSDHSYDITKIDSEPEAYNLIICYHILEHIENDSAAMDELFRVLKKNGYCLIQTPFKEGDIYEDYSITTPKERELHFGQSDHVRIYSVNGLKNRLENAGFNVEIKNFIEKSENLTGFSARETVLICHKPT
ncbi:MAG: methyltransferase domain-containing protein [Cryomorphaceae bacterium]|nr:methyltransferase domain-containing protein [Cryomorphaceae bacterium]